MATEENSNDEPQQCLPCVHPTRHEHRKRCKINYET